MNLLNEGSFGPQLFSPQRIQKARELQSQIEAYETQRRDVNDKRLAAATKKAQQESDKAQRALQVSIRRQVATEAKAQKATEKRAQAEVKKRLATPGKKQVSRLKDSTDANKILEVLHKSPDKVNLTIAVAAAERPILMTSAGRRICRPQRFLLRSFDGQISFVYLLATYIFNWHLVDTIMVVLRPKVVLPV